MPSHRRRVLSSGGDRNGDAHGPADSILPSCIRAALLQLPEAVDRLLGPSVGGRQAPSVTASATLRALQALEAVSMASKTDKLTPQVHEGLVLTFLQLREGAVAMALLRLVAAVVRWPEEAEQEEGAHLYAAAAGTAQPFTASNSMWQESAESIGEQACSFVEALLSCCTTNVTVVRRLVPFALQLLCMQTLQACARQLAAATGRLSTAAYRRHAITRLDWALFLVAALTAPACNLKDYPSVQAYAENLAVALRDSCLIEHANRLLLHLMIESSREGPADPAEQAALARSAQVLARMCMRLFLMRSIECGGNSDITARSQTSRCLGELLCEPCTRHALLTLAVATLCTADGGPAYGLPEEVLRAVPQGIYTSAASSRGSGDGSVQGAGLQLAGHMMTGFAQFIMAYWKESLLGHRAALSLLMRCCRLGVGSALAVSETESTQSASPAAAYGRNSDGGGAAGYQRHGGAGGLRMLLAPAGATEVAVTALNTAARLLWDVTLATRPPAEQTKEEQEEWWGLTLALTGARQALSQASVTTRVRFGMNLAIPFVERESVLHLPPQPIPLVVSAVAGGLLPGLERLLRRAAVHPEGPEADIAISWLQMLDRGCVPGPQSWYHLAPPLAYGEPRQAAALVVTMAKLLRRGVSGRASGAQHGAGRALLSGVQNVMASFLFYAVSQPWVNGTEGQVTPAAAQLGVVLSCAAREWLPMMVQLHAMWRATRRDGQEDREPEEPPAQLVEDAQATMRWLTMMAHLSATCDGDASAEAQAGGGDGNGRAVSGGVVGGCGSVRRDDWWLDPLVMHMWTVEELMETDRGCMLSTDLLAACVAIATARPGVVRSSLVAAAAAASCDGDVGGSEGTHRHAAEPPWSPRVMKNLHISCWCDNLIDEADCAVAMLARFEAWAAKRPQCDAEEKGNYLDYEAVVSRAAADYNARYSWLARVLAPSRDLSHLLRTCSNPDCIRLEGDSELAVPLQACSRCGGAWYCCRECQTAHWRAGHKAACGAVATSARGS